MCRPRDAIIPYQLTWLEQGKRPDRIHAHAIVSDMVNATRQEYIKLRGLHEDGSFSCAVQLMVWTAQENGTVKARTFRVARTKCDL